MIKIYGKVTDFNDTPIKDAEIEIKDKNFGTIYQTFSDTEGKYSLRVEERTYISLTACKDYKTKNLEYWAWNIIASQDLQINPRIDGIEVYAMNAWVPQGAMPSLQIYFRPMSLERIKNKGGVDIAKKLKIIDITPELTKKDIILKIDNELVDILEINKIRECVGENQSIFGYLIQSSLPKHQTDLDYYLISITLRDSQTNEKGEGCLYWKKPCYV